MGVLAQARRPDLFSVAWLKDNGISILIIVVVTVILLVVARTAVRRVQKRLAAAATGDQVGSLRRVATLTQALWAALRLAIVTVAVLMVLGQLGLDLAPLIAGAGIVGVALGFGAQALVRDFLSGFFILSEDQFSVGELVEISSPGGKVTGRVESITLRITTIRAFDGTQNIVPNGSILVVGNRSRGWARAIVDVRLAYKQDLEVARRSLEELFGQLTSDQTLGAWLQRSPVVLGVEDVQDGQVVLRVAAEVEPNHRLDVERELRARIKGWLDRKGIATPGMPEPAVAKEPAPPVEDEEALPVPAEEP